ncbi:hypothetical protein EYF80_044081 [Liparis tanakae]|uniref:Uncharacterized protein n=1 Tax=Liparis tanakae TaxID=230148 RepID=A0A4Z2FXX0_9TELE|nr:hypothetical protein EYF80_044081 [Liparis tanakae]
MSAVTAHGKRSATVRRPVTATSLFLRLATCSGDNAALINPPLIENSEPYTSGCCLEMETRGGLFERPFPSLINWARDDSASV